MLLLNGKRTLCSAVAKRSRHTQLVAQVVDHVAKLDGHLTFGTHLLGDLGKLQRRVDFVHCLGVGQWRGGRHLDLQAVDPQRQIDHAALVHDFQNLGDHGDHGFVDQSAKRAAQVLRQLLHALDNLGG